METLKFLGGAIVSVTLYFLFTSKVLKLRRFHPLQMFGVQIALYGSMLFWGILWLISYIRTNLDLALSLQAYRQSIIFGCYLFTIPVFAAIYYRLYRNNRANFSFSSAISEDQVARTRDWVQKQLADREQSVDILQQAAHRIKDYGWEVLFTYEAASSQVTASTAERLKSTMSHNRRRLVVLTDGSYTDCRTDLVPNNSIASFLYVGNISRELSSYNFPNSRPDNVRDYLDYHEEALIRCKQSVKHLRERLESLNSNRPDAWNLFDFMYFSTITQTTVGYGDILPNSTIVRAFVTLQILIGYFILAVLINFTFGHRS